MEESMQLMQEIEDLKIAKKDAEARCICILVVPGISKTFFYVL